MSDATGDEARKRMQIKSFTTWINLHLAKVGYEVSDLKTDFADGIKLLKLVEVISEESLGKHNKKPISKFQKVENLNIPLKYINGFIKEQGISNQYSAENILEENEVLILGMFWQLILRFAVQEISEGDRTAKEGLLLWAQKKVEEGSKGKVSVTNFHTSWQDGTAFCALIQAFRPDLIDASAVRKSDDQAVKMRNLNLAFDAANSHLGIPKMLDATDMTSCARPDEKSVMTYISFFWKEFASNKKKALAAERISNVVAREVQFAELQQAYEAQATALATWLEQTHSRFSAGTESLSPVELHATLDAYVEYERTERPAKIQELMEIEALDASISSRLAALGRTYAPAEAIALPSLQRWWEQLTLAERSYEETIKASLGNVKQMGRLVKLFNSKASKLEGWAVSKAAWLHASHHLALAALGKPLDRASPAPWGGSPIPVPTDGFDKLTDPTNAAPPPLAATISSTLAPDASTPQPAMRARSVSMPTPPSSAPIEGGAPADAPPRAQDDEALLDSATDSNGKPKRASFFGDLFAAIQDNISGRGSMENVVDGEGGDGEGGVTPLVLKTPRSMEKYNEEVRLETARQAEGGKGLDLASISAVIAKLNLLKAYEEEQASRGLTLEALRKLQAQLEGLGFDSMDKIGKRYDELHGGMSALIDAAKAYRADLDEALSRHKALDEQRLLFAKRAEALNRWIEEGHDAMSEVLHADSTAEADAAQAELATFLVELETQKSELASLTSLQAEMDGADAGANPYSRFHIDELGAMLTRASDAAAERSTALDAARVQISEIDAQKKEFAEVAEAMLTHVKSEKAGLEAQARGVHILPDEMESIAKGKEQLEVLSQYVAKASERQELLKPAQAISDALMAAAEMDNPYTRLSMASLKSAVDQLEKLARDAINLIEGQLARAQASVTPEQHAELRQAFEHFDRTGDGMLNTLEFGAAMKSMDFEGDGDEMFNKLASTEKLSSEGTPQPAIDFNAFLTIVLQQYKDKDTMDGLLTAFRALANGKDMLPPEALTETLKPAHAAFLQERLVAGADGGPMHANRRVLCAESQARSLCVGART